MAEPKVICEKCGKIHTTMYGGIACSAHVRGDAGTPCTKSPIAGGKVCRSHGGALPHVKAAAAERVKMMTALGEVADLMRECDLPDQHPIDGLLECVRVSGSMMRLLTVKVGELREDPNIREVLVEGPKGELSTKFVATDNAFWGLNSKEEMAPSIYVTLLGTWTERYEKACKTALDAGIEERRIQLAEDTSETFFSALGKAVAAAGLSPDLRATLNTALAAELRKSVAIDLL